MRRIRVIPVLLLTELGLVKTIKFRQPRYLGDPINAVRIFNDKQVDELILLDIEAGVKGRVDFDRIEDIVSEAFMPVAYGGGISTLDQCAELLRRGVEKVVLNTSAWLNPALITEAAARFGSQSVVVSIDVKANLFGVPKVRVRGARHNTRLGPVEMARRSVGCGAGEIFLTSVEREGKFCGYDLALFRSVTAEVDVPVIGHGGARNLDDFRLAVQHGGCSAVAAASLFVYVREGDGILISYPSEDELRTNFWSLLE